MAEQRYKVIERIDAGGMAEVFKANSTSMQGFQKLVAIKRILPSLTQNERFVRMFLDEAKVSLHLNHTNCVHVFDLGIADGTYFIVMEFVNGTNLKKMIEFMHRRKRQMRIEQAVFIAIEVCKGLTHAHEKRDQDGNPLDIVHRDISPPNVLISKAGEIKITDFGLAKAKSQAEVTDPGVVKGKFGYLSPEAAHGKDVDVRTDIFAVGILLWEMLAGRRLFLGESDFETLQQVKKAKIPSLSGIRSDMPPQLEAVLNRTLTRDPDKRIQTAKELAIDLANFLFEFGEVVTNYHLSELVLEVVDQRPQRARTAKDLAVDAAIQKQLNQLKSLEQIKDLDLYLAQHYDSLPDQGEVAAGGDGNFEDPRMWADMGFGGDPADGAAPAPLNKAGGAGQPDSWQEAGLADIAHQTSSYKAVTGSPPGQNDGNGGPPTLPGGVKASALAEAARAGEASRAAQAAAAAARPEEQRPPERKQPAATSAAPSQTAHKQPAPNEPAISPRKERTDTPISSASVGAGSNAFIITAVVAFIVVVVGLGGAALLGLIP